MKKTEGRSAAARFSRRAPSAGWVSPRYRKRRAQTRELAAAMDGLIASGQPAGEEMEDLLWEALLLFEGFPFYTSKRLDFTYSIRGYEMFVTRKDKSITRSTVMLTFRRAVEIQQTVGRVTGPKKLGTFGASYLYPIFRRIGVIRSV